MQSEDFRVIANVFESLNSFREVSEAEEKVHKKVCLILKQMEVSEKAQKELEQIRQDLNELNK